MLSQRTTYASRASVLCTAVLLSCSSDVRFPDVQRSLEDVAARREVSLSNELDSSAALDGNDAADSAPNTTDEGQPSLGAQSDDGGVRFRVWAPGAERATVTGTFGEHAMTRDDGGVYEAYVPNARVGHSYRYSFQRAGRTLLRVDPRGHELREGASVVSADTYAWRSTAFQPPALRETVLYELHIGSFSVATGARNGTFTEVTRRLDGLAELGVNALQLLPVHSFGNGTRWGYNPQHWHAPNASYGTPDELRQLIDEAHRRGIAVVFDLVYNHYDGGRDAPLRCFDGDCEDGSAGLYFFRAAPYASTPWGPRPEFSSDGVRAYLLDGITHWLQSYRVDGFRWDSLSNVRGIDGMGMVPGGRALVVEGNTRTRALRPGALLIAEDLKGLAEITRPTSAGGFGFDTQWDGFVYVLGEQLAGNNDDARDLNAVRAAILGGYNGDPLQRIVGTENHDTVGNNGLRFPQRIDGQDPGSWAARKRSMLAAALAFTVPGVPMLFMGQEHLEVGTFAPEPRPIDWSREQAHARVRAFYRALVHLRRNLEGVSAGLLGAGVAVHHFSDANKVLSFRRWNTGSTDEVMVLVNLRNRRYATYNIGVSAGGTWRVRLDTDDPQWSTDFGGAGVTTLEATAQPYDGMPFRLSVPLGPWSLVALSRPTPAER